MKNISTVGIIGAGKMGAAISQKLAQEGFKIIMLDRDIKYVDSGFQNITETLHEGLERKIFSANTVKSILSNIIPTTNSEELKKCDLIIEAIFEDFDAKYKLFKDIDAIVGRNVIIATNTSSFLVTELAAAVSNPERFIGLHYFYHAAKNRLVEIIPGKFTSADTIKSVKLFCVLSGKDQITCKDSYGFAVNRFFVPWLNEAARLAEENTATAFQIDKVCEKVFSVGMGPFALMNATGVPIAFHSQKTLEIFGNSYKVSELLKKQSELAKPWNIPETNAEIQPDIFNNIKDRMLGIVFLVCCQLLDEGVCPATEINRGARIGLRWRRGPIELMNEIGDNEVERLISNTCKLYNELIPKSIRIGYRKVEYIAEQISGSNAVITMSRPEDMNALNEEIITELQRKFTNTINIRDIDNIFITGSGKAFVAGADIKFFLENIRKKSIDNIVKFTEYGQHVFDAIENSEKKVVTIVNGLTLGGGLELALCSDVILSFPNSVFAFPETGIGIYPGLGGTQRTQKRIGKALTKYLIFTGNILRAEEAVKIGLIDGIILPVNIYDLFEGRADAESFILSGQDLDEQYLSLTKFFENKTVKELLNTSISELPDSEAKILAKIKQKAPLALYTAEKLINEAKGPASELEYLSYIFSTDDALLGLSSIGKKVQFQGK